MPTYSIDGPDGKTYSIDGPEGATRDQVIAKIKEQQPQTGTVKAASSTMGDVATSFGRGVAKGAIGLAGLPGDVSNLVGEGVEKGGELLGLEPRPVPKLSGLPTSGDITGAVEGVTGKFDTPKTTAGKYAESVGEFVPSAVIGPGRLAAKAATTVAGGLGAEAGGELTEGSSLEPYGRFAGGLAGGSIPGGAVRLVSPIASTVDRQAAVALLEHEGVTAPTAGQRTGNTALKYTESYLGDAPGAGGAAREATEQVGRQFTRAALRRAGVNADVATPAVIDGAFTRIGNVMDGIAARNDARMDAQFAQEINAARDEYYNTVQEGSRRAVIDNTLNDFFNRATQSPILTGEQFQRFRSRLTRLQRSAAGDPEYSAALGDFVEAMDGMLTRSITNQADLAALQEARRQYRNLIPLSNASIGAGEQAAEGIITPGRLRSVLTGTQRGKRDYARGRGDLADLTRAGNVILTPLPNSGTAQRGMMAGLTGAAGASATLAATGRYGEAAAAAAAAAAPGLAGRALMSPLSQRYLANQVAPGLADQFPPATARALQSALAADANSPLAQPGN